MKDLEAIALLTRDLYAAISFEEGEKPDPDRLKDLFLSPGNLINNNEAHPMIWNLETFVETYREQLSGGALHSFIEEEISAQTDLFGSVAHRFSTYQARFRAGQSEAVILGINSIQFIKTGGAWRVVSIIWNDQKEDLPIPEKYL